MTETSLPCTNEGHTEIKIHQRSDPRTQCPPQKKHWGGGGIVITEQNFHLMMCDLPKLKPPEVKAEVSGGLKGIKG